jgi:hypothetical protein
VFFKLPDKQADWTLLDPAGLPVALQRGPAAEGSFLLHRPIDAGAADVYTLVPEGARSAPAKMTAQLGDGTLRLRDGNRLVLDFHVEPSRPPPGVSAVYRRSGYIHPLFTPSGKAVTGDYGSDNPHQHGIWWAWPNTEFEGRTPNFWDAVPTNNPAQHAGAGTGRVELEALDTYWSGPVHAGFRARLRSVDQSARPEKTALLETWTVRVYAMGADSERLRIVDLACRQECAGSSPIRFPEHRYGGFSIRGRHEWVGPGDAARCLTSSGETDRQKAHASRSRWCYMGGLLDGAPAGLAVLAHPENFRFPEPLRVHDQVPFLNFAPSQAGPWELTPESPIVWRYRIVVQDGAPRQEQLEALWRDFANPVKATLEPDG